MIEQILKAAKETFEFQAECLRLVFDRIDKTAFLKAVDALEAAPRIAVSACGHSGIASQHFAHLMCCIGRPARFIYPSEAIHGALGFVQPGDVMVLASRGGKTEELIPVMDICKTKGTTIISITQNLESSLAQGADIVLYMHVTKEADPFNTQGTTSHAVLNAIYDALQTALVHKTGFKPDQFALVHPGGAVGKWLNRTEEEGKKSINPIDSKA